MGEVAQSLWCCVDVKTSVFNQDGFLENGSGVHFSFLFFRDSLNIVGGLRPLEGDPRMAHKPREKALLSHREV